MKKIYVYILASMIILIIVGSKIGVSFYPERRATQLKRLGFFIVFSKYEIHAREEALRIEEIIINEFSDRRGIQGRREFFLVEPQIVDKRLQEIIMEGC